jgi:putative restriction endonuclease
VAVDDLASISQQIDKSAIADNRAEARRAYITATVKVRLYQQSFRERVLNAYHSQCSLCRLRHIELLDAAHIIPDNASEGLPKVTNGIALCKLHHAAFDSLLLGVSPDYKVHVRNDVLDEDDGPLLQYGLQAIHGSRLILPTSRSQWPSQEALEWRFQRFTETA